MFKVSICMGIRDQFLEISLLLLRRTQARQARLIQNLFLLKSIHRNLKKSKQCNFTAQRKKHRSFSCVL